MKRSGRECGFTTVQYVVATSFSLVLFVVLANVLVDSYERAAVREALDEGVRSAVPSGSELVCTNRARASMRARVGGAHVRIDQLRCRRAGDAMVAEVHVTFRSWLPRVLPDWSIRLRASARVQR